MISNFSKFKLLLWKNITILRRHPIKLILEIVIPVIQCMILLFLRANILPTETDQSSMIYLHVNQTTHDRQLANNIVKHLSSRGLVKVEDDEEKVTFLRSSHTKGRPFRACGIEVDDVTKHVLAYRIKVLEIFNDSSLFEILQTQKEMNDDFIREVTGQEPKLKFSGLEEINDPFLEFLQEFLQIVLLVSFILPVITITGTVCLEKEYQLKDYMKIMGIQTSLHWFAYFVTYFVQIVLLAVMIAIVTKINPGMEFKVFEHTSFGVICTFMVLYSISVIAFSFMMSTLGPTANITSKLATISWFINYIPFTIVGHRFSKNPLWQQMSISLFSNTAMALGISNMIVLEKRKVGSQWDNLFERCDDNNMAVGHTFIMLIVDTVLYTLIAVYLEKVFPGAHGIPLKWYFPFTKHFWCGGGKKKPKPEVVETSENSHELFEPQSLPKNVAVEVRHLQKIYPGNKVAVKGISFKLYEDDIVILLGHNSAGKSTTISMLTGLLQPTTGKVLIYGEDIHENSETAHTSIGLCPQHNILFEDLNVKEHIIFYSRLKGIRGQSVQDAIEKLVSDLHLEDQLEIQVKNLSGGIKRVLSVSLAFCGDPKFVVLDEPSSGLDPVSMRIMWQMLIARKEGRTILISTHSMQEADIINDRIAVMSEGTLMCYGTSDFLKHKISEGYKLSIKSTMKHQGNLFLSLAHKYVTDPVMHDTKGDVTELTLKTNDLREIPALLKELEESKERYDIVSFSVSSPTIEEVFMKLGREVPEEHQDEEEFNMYDSKASFASEYFRLNYGISRVCNQIRAMFYKSFCYMRGNYLLILFMYIFTIIFILMTYARNEDARYDHKATNLDELLKYCKSMILRDFGIPPGSNRKAETQYEFLCQHYLQEELSNTQSHLSMRSLPQEIKDARDNFVNILYRRKISPITIFYINHIYNQYIQKFYSNYTMKIKTTVEPLFLSDIGLDFDSVLELLKYRDVKYYFVLRINSAYFCGLGPIFAASYFILFYVRERNTLFRFIQRIAGLNTGVYWFVAFFIDYILFLSVLIVYFGMIVLVGIDLYSSFEELQGLLVVGLIFPLAILPITYLLSFLFEHSTYAYIWTLVGYVFFGVIMGVVTSCLDFFHVGMPTLENVLMIAPPYAFTSAIVNSGKQNMNRMICQQACEKMKNVSCTPEWRCEQAPEMCCDTLEYQFSFESPGLGLIVTLLIVVAFVATFLLLMIDFEIFKQWFSNTKGGNKNYYEVLEKGEQDGVDEDVVQEKIRVRSMGKDEIEDQQLVTKDLSKCYGKMVAVNQLCLSIEKYECFGIFGQSSAGKTTIVKMITGALSKSSGNVWIGGYSLTHELSKVHTLIGYCPQFKGLLEDLTGYETMRIIAMLRGYQDYRIHYVIYRLAEEFYFVKHLHKAIKKYSGGTKRKLSTALTLIGNTAIVILDEPTTGIDPGARKQLWNVINQARECRKTILLTSQMMEECETLCTNLSVLVKGNLKCIGTKEHLRKKYLNGFILELKLKPMIPRNSKERVTKAKDYFHILFHDAQLKEEYLESLIYFIPSEYRKLYEIFEAVALAKEFLSIEDFAVKDATLEQIFMFFN